MSETSLSDTIFHRRLRASSNKLLWLGLLMLILGVAAIVFPVVSTLVAALLVGWVFLISGGLMFFSSFTIHGTEPFFGALLFSILSLIAGIFLLFNPLSAAIALTLIMGVIFVIQGAFELFFAFQMRPHPGWAGMMLSGFATILLAVLIAAGWPSISAIALGILLGVNFISTGMGYVFVWRALTPIS